MASIIVTSFRKVWNGLLEYLEQAQSQAVKLENDVLKFISDPGLDLIRQ